MTEPEKFFAFLEDASQNTNLAKIREESTRVVAEEEENEIEEDEKQSEKEGRRRIYSPTLEQLIKKHSDRYTCYKKEADTTCFFRFFKPHVPFFGAKYTDLELFESQLRALSEIIHHLVPKTSYLRNFFTKFTNAFNAFIVPRVELLKPFQELVREILHGEPGKVLQYIRENKQRRSAKLADAYEENWDTVTTSVHKMFRYGEEGNGKTFGMATLLALECCTGARKGAYLDPHVEFYTWEEYKAQHRADNDGLGPFDVGSNKASLTLQHLQDNKFTSSVLVQVGVLKDARMKLAKHLPEDERPEPRLLIKPCLLFPAQYLVDKIRAFRAKYEITKEKFTSRANSSNSWGSRLYDPLLLEYFRASYQKAERKGWIFGTHHMRRIYAMASFGICRDSVQRASGQIITQASWMALVLGHMGSEETTLSYSNIQIVFTPKSDLFQIPPLDLITQLARQVGDLQKQIDKLQRAQSSAEAATEIMNENSCNTAAFVKEDGKIITLQKHTKRKFTGEADRQNTVNKLALSLTANGLKVNAANLGKLGIGRKLQIAFLKSERNSDEELKAQVEETQTHVEEHEQKQVHVEPIATPPPAEDNNELDNKHNDDQPQRPQRTTKRTQERIQTPHEEAYGKNKKYAKLNAKQKVISHSSSLSEGANAERHRRDLKNPKFKGKVIQRPEDCKGTIIPSVQLGPKFARDVCDE